MIKKFEEFVCESQAGQGQMMSFEDIHKIYDNFVDNFDIETIPLSIRKRCYKNFKDIYDIK